MVRTADVRSWSPRLDRRAHIMPVPTRSARLVHSRARSGRTCQTAVMAQRFLTLADVTEILNISSQQAYALVRSGELPAMQVGGQGKAGQWRVEVDQLEAYIARMYSQTRARIERTPSEAGQEH